MIFVEQFHLSWNFQPEGSFSKTGLILARGGRFVKRTVLTSAVIASERSDRGNPVFKGIEIPRGDIQQAPLDVQTSAGTDEGAHA